MPATGRLRIKRIYEPAESSDGTRVLVDRIWPRGMSKESAAVDFWLRDIAPSASLRKWFGHDPARWDVFQRRYREELNKNEANVGMLRDLIGKHKVTLLYGARDTVHNQAAVLLDYLGEH